MPIEGGGPATVPALRRAAARSAPYPLGAAFAYPFRGRGGLLVKMYVVLLAAVSLLAVLPGCGSLLVVLCMAVALLPGLICAIVRTTAAGEIEVPDWPDISEVQERASEAVGLLMAAALALMPGALLLLALGCDPLGWRGGGGNAAHALCWLGLSVGLFGGVLLALPAVAAVAAFWSPWLAWRVDLHVRALAAGGRDSLRIAGLVYACLVGDLLSNRVLRPIPVVDAVVGTAVEVYLLVLSAHLIGLIVRRHHAALEAIYLMKSA